ARERGVDVPGDLSVSGFDDSPLAALPSPSLTSVRVDYAEFGAAAAALLLAAVAGEPAPAYGPSRPQLITRASTAAPRRRRRTWRTTSATASATKTAAAAGPSTLKT